MHLCQGIFKMTKNRFILLIFIFLSFTEEGISQNIFFDLRKTEKRADFYYSKLSYSKAIDLYTQALKNKKNKADYKLNKKAAELYRKMGRYEEAKKCFDNLVRAGYVLTSQDSIDYSNISKAAGINEPDIDLPRISSGKILNDLFRDTLYYSVQELSFNTENSEYCAVSFNKGLLYVSDQPPSALVKKYNMLNDGGFASLYYVEKDDTNWSAHKKNNIGLANAIHVGPLAFYNNQKNAIVNVCMEDKKKPYRLLLYKTEYDQEKKQWKELSPMPFNSKLYSVGHPAISEDGKRIFFISDQEGGIGGTDLYVSSFIDGKWSAPENMGAKINTKGNEKYPYISKDNILFFSTDGRYGLGASDIYYVDLDFKDSTVLNMGSPVNSSLDDFGFSYDEVNKTGYFSSNRKSKGKQDDLYSFKENKILLTVFLIDDFDRTKLENAQIQVWDSELKIPVRHFKGVHSNEVNVWLKPAHRYKMIVQKEDYKNDTLIISTYDAQDYSKGITKDVYIKRKIVYFANIKLHNEVLRDSMDNSFIIINNITNKGLDTIHYHTDSLQIKLDGDCEYIITSGNKDSLRYIYIGKKVIKDLSSKLYYNMYLSSARPALLNLAFEKCTEDTSLQNTVLKIKVVDWVNGNVFYIFPNADNVFQFVVTDPRLVSFYLNENRISPSVQEIKPRKNLTISQ